LKKARAGSGEGKLIFLEKKNLIKVVKGVIYLNLEEKLAPEFSLPGTDGKDHSLEDYRGKKIVLYFYPKDNTGG